MSRFLFLLLIASVAGCGGHKGAIKPNAALADFDKYRKAYYLSTRQFAMGATQAQVIKEYGDDYEIVNVNDQDGHKLETWKFVSYRATSGRDPVDKLVFVLFRDGLVTRVWEERPDGSSLVEASPDPIRELEGLKRLLDLGAITNEEYENKKRQILDRM